MLKLRRVHAIALVVILPRVGYRLADMVNALHTTWCLVRDMRAARSFYEGVLGLRPGYASEHWTEYDLGNGKIALHLGGAESSGGRGWTLGLVTDDLAALKSRLIGAAVTVEDYHETPNGVIVEFHDPDGNVIQAIQPGSSLSDFA
jgi:catechol 2,3-dioxygenase-like lactoylglutathione lyase family enzyme